MTLPAVVLSGCLIPLSTSVRSLGVIVDSGLTFSDHVSKLVNNCYYQLRQIRSIRRSLTIDSTHALVRALVLSRIDYCNSLLGGISGTLLKSSGRCYEGRCSSGPAAAVQGSRHDFDPGSTPLARCCLADHVQTMRARLLLSKQSRSALPRRTLRPSRNHSGSIETSVRSGG